MSEKSHPEVDGYISTFDKKVQEALESIRQAVREAAPDAEEYFGYKMPAYRFFGPVAYFAGWKSHIGYYPAGMDLGPLEEKVKKYRHGKGSLRFPIGEPIPLDLVKAMVRLRMKENEAMNLAKKTKSQNK